MRLTLRTLLAWLDDTLSPAEVRQIGQQVSTSPFAQELVEKVHRVTRQRRLTVPSGDGADATDPNLVAEYIDNQLTVEQVTDYEKLCLTSDVNLAETASVHQILSLLGQKAKVPAEAKHRMYQLIKGRESAASRTAPRAAEPTPVESFAPPAPWSATDLPTVPWWEKYGPGLGVVSLILILCWGAWYSIGPATEPLAPGNLARSNEPVARDKPRGRTSDAKDQAADSASNKAEAAPAKGAVQGEPKDKGTDESKPDPAAEEKTGEPKEETKDKAEAKPSSVPAGSVGLGGSADAVLLRYNVTDRHWDFLPAGTPLKDKDRIVSLAPFLNPVDVGDAHFTLIREAEIIPLAAEAGLAASIELVRGRILLAAMATPKPVGVTFAGRLLKITPPPNVAIGLERLENRGQVGGSRVLGIHVPSGEASVTAGVGKESLTGPGVLEFLPPDQFRPKSLQSSPAWVTETSISADERQVGTLFVPYFKVGVNATYSLVEASEADQKEIRRRAIEALGAVGNYGAIVRVMGKPNDPTARRAAIEVLRSALARSPESAKEVKAEIQSYYPDEPLWSAAVEKLLIGYSPKQAREEDTYTTLVKYLSSKDLGIRELAIDNLRSLTGRDSMDYDADKPEGAGLKAWQTLEKKKELKSKAAAAPVKG